MDFSETIGLLNTARVWLQDSEYGEWTWWAVAALAAIVAAVKVSLLTFRATKSVVGGAMRLASATWRLARWADSPLCSTIVEAVRQPGSMWDAATREFVCNNGLLMQITAPNHAIPGVRAIYANGRECGRDLTPKEIRRVEAAVAAAIRHHEKESREARRAESLAQVQLCGGPPLVAQFDARARMERADDVHGRPPV